VALVALILTSLDGEPPAAVAPPSPPPPASEPPAIPTRPRVDAAMLLADAPHASAPAPHLDPDRPEPPISRETVAAIRPLLLAIVKECAMPLRSQVPVQKGRLMVTMHMRTRSGAVDILDTHVRQDRVSDRAVVDCVQRRFESAALPAAADQPYAEQEITMPFPVP
jgi:hypothetical protein